MRCTSARPGGRVPCEVVDRHQLRDGERVLGPAVVEETDSTTIVYPGYAALSADHGVLVVSRIAEPA